MVVFLHAARMLMVRAVARAIGLCSILRDSFIEARRARTTLEAELFQGRYRLPSKNDDDLPIVH
jgi:hypothetical protein